MERIIPNQFLALRKEEYSIVNWMANPLGVYIVDSVSCCTCFSNANWDPVREEIDTNALDGVGQAYWSLFKFFIILKASSRFALGLVVAKKL